MNTTHDLTCIDGRTEVDSIVSRSSIAQELGKHLKAKTCSAITASDHAQVGPEKSRVSSSRVMRVLHVIDNLDVGGTETQMVQVARRLDPRFYQVTVATLRAGGPLTELLVNAGIRVMEFPKRGSMLSFQAAYQLIRMAWFIRRERIDVIHAHDLWANQMAVPAARLAGARVIISSQRNLAHASWYTPFRKKAVSRIHLLATYVIVNAEAVRQLLLTDFRIPPQHVQLLHNGVDFEVFAKARCDRQRLFPALKPSAKLIINVENMNSEVKGHAILIEAARTVCTAIPEARFAFVGDGLLRPWLERRVLELGLHEHFLFLGPRRDVPDILSCGDLFVFPSFAEGLPNSVLEAAAAGLPIIATPVGGVPEIIKDRVTGLVVPPKDPLPLVEAILEM